MTKTSRGGRGGTEPRTRIRAREGRAMELATQGWSQHRIAAELQISQPAVSKLLRRVEDRILRELTAAVERQKARHTLRLEHLYAEALRAWEQSKQDATRRRQRKTVGRAGGATGATVAELVVEEQHGDPRYLEEGRKALADLRKLWGLDAPHKVDIRATRKPVRRPERGRAARGARPAGDTPGGDYPTADPRGDGVGGGSRCSRLTTCGSRPRSKMRS